jgi:hypothetical protein
MNDAIVYEVHLHRPREPYLNFSLSCRDVKISYNPGRQSGMTMLCRAMKDRGLPDGRLRVVETDGGPMRYELPSMHAIADKEVRSAGIAPSRPEGMTEPSSRDTRFGIISPTQRNAMVIVVDRPQEWGRLHHKTRKSITGAGWVTLEGDTPILSKKGKEIAKHLKISLLAGEEP